MSASVDRSQHDVRSRYDVESRVARDRSQRLRLRPSTPDDTNSLMTDCASETNSDASSSNSNGLSLLDFIGSRCMSGSSHFTSFFPCTVADVDDVEDRDAVDKLSREKAMNSMYATGGSRRKEKRSAWGPSDEASDGRAIAPKPDFIAFASTAPELVEDGLTGEEEEGEDARDDAPTCQEPLIYSIPSAVVEDDCSVADEGETSVAPRPEPAPIDAWTCEEPLIYSVLSTVDEEDCSVAEASEATIEVEASEATIEVHVPVALTESPFKKKRKKFGRNLFGRKKKAA